MTAVSGGSTAQIVTYRPLGKGRTLSLSEIPDGGITTLGARINATLAATLTDVELFILVESLQSTPLPSGTYEAFGNFIYNGRPGGTADPLFSQVLSITGALAPDSPNDDSVDIWTRVAYTLAGVEYIFAPSTTEIVFNATAGDGALSVGEEYIAAVTLDGTGTPTVTKGNGVTAPAQESDRPTAPADEILAGWVTVPETLVITTVEDVLALGFFGATQTGGLGVDIGPGRGLVGDYRWDSETTTSLTLADDTVTEVYVRPAGGLEQVTTGNSPADPHSMLIWTYTTASGSITVEIDGRRIGSGVVTGGQASLGQNDDRRIVLFGADYDSNGTYTYESVTGLAEIVTGGWRQITPYAAQSANPMLLPADGTINLKASSTDANDDGDPAGTGAQTLRAVYLDSVMARVAVDATLDGQTGAAINAAALGLVTARVSAVGSGAMQAGDLYAYDDAGGLSSGVPQGNVFGKAPLELPFAPVPALGDPAGVMMGMVFAVPTANVCAISQLAIVTDGPVLVQIMRKSALGTFAVLPPTPFAPGSPPIRWEAPVHFNDAGEPAAIPEENWIYGTAISRGSSSAHVSGRLDVILLGTA